MPPLVLIVSTPVITIIAIVMAPPIMLAIVLSMMPVIFSIALIIQVQFKQSRPIQITMLTVLVAAVPVPKVSIANHPSGHVAIMPGIAMIDTVNVGRRIDNDLSSTSAAWG
jgi:hypothetical protein